MHILIVAPSLDVAKNVSGLSAVTSFIIGHNKACEYEHFLQGRGDGESGAMNRVMRIWRNYRAWIARIGHLGEGIIHYNYPLDAASIIRDYFFLKAAHRRGLRMVIHIHGGLYLFREQKPFVIRRILSEVFSWDHPFIVLSEKEREQIRRVYGTRHVSVLPNCVDLTEAAQYHKAIETDELDMLYLGRIEPNKGMDYMLEAMKVLKEKGRRFTLHFAGIEQGRNGYIEKFTDLLGDSFVYEGVVSGRQKTELLKRCQVFLLPSLYEGLPMSLIETMSFGLVPVVTDVGSIGEYVKDGENGLMVGIRDAAAIVKALERLIADRALTARLSAAARQTVMDRLQPEKYVEKLNKIYAETL